MIDLRQLRTDPDGVRAALGRRGMNLAPLERLVELDSASRTVSKQRDDIRARIKNVSKEVGQLRGRGDTVAGDAKAAESRALGDQETALDARATSIDDEIREILLVIPNLPHPDAPDGAGEHDNPLVKGPIGMPAQWDDHHKVPHWETGVALGILDNERAAKITGTMFTMQRGLGATMARALCQLALDRNAAAFEEIRPPSLVSTATLTATGQLPKFADDAYAIERDDLWCVPTAEVPLTSMYRDEILTEDELPRRFMAYTPCYRREAGSAGRDTRGMLRGHEFDKVEILALATPAQAPALLDELVACAEGTIAALGLPYRVIEICTGDMGQSHHRSFDIEVWAPGSDRWLEVSSVSWFSDYQARRGNLRYRPKEGKGTQLLHTLNGSALAVPRVWAAILEVYREADGSVTIPGALRPYMRGATSIPVR